MEPWLERWGSPSRSPSIRVRIRVFSTGFNVQTADDGLFKFGGAPTDPSRLGVSFFRIGFKPFSGRIDPTRAEMA